MCSLPRVPSLLSVKLVYHVNVSVRVQEGKSPRTQHLYKARLQYQGCHSQVLELVLRLSRVLQSLSGAGISSCHPTLSCLRPCLPSSEVAFCLNYGCVPAWSLYLNLHLYWQLVPFLGHLRQQVSQLDYVGMSVALPQICATVGHPDVCLPDMGNFLQTSDASNWSASA